MIVVLGFALLVLITLTDITSAFIFAQTDSQYADSLRHLRDGIALILAAVGLIRGGLPIPVLVAGAVYTSFIVVYVLAGLGTDTGLLISSTGRLAVPILFLLAGAAVLRDMQTVRSFITVMVVLAICSFLFGLWEVSRTEFWERVVAYGEYLYSLKGIETGYHPVYFLPWNFFRETDIRRAAGLLAAPLAQGSYLAIAGLLGFAMLRAKRLWLGIMILMISALGILESGTRGAMLILLVGLSCFLILTASKTLRRGWDTIAITAGVLIVVEILSVLVISTIRLDDSSGLGHLQALIINITNLGPVLFIGGGMGAAGPDASLFGLSILGGGEGAIFSIIYQMGMPAGIVFLLMYGAIVLTTFIVQSGNVETRNFALGVGSLAVGSATSLILSEHLLTVSGMAGFWMVAGGAMVICERERRMVAS